MNKLQIKIIYFLMVAIPLVAGSYFFVYENITQRKTAEINKNMTITRSMAMFIEYDINGELERMKQVASLPVFKNFDQDKMYEAIELFYSPNHKEQFYVADSEGNIVTGYPEYIPSSNYNLKQSPYFIKAMQGKAFVTGEHKTLLTGGYKTGLYVPIFDNSGKVIGILASHLANSFFKHHLDPIRIGQSGSMSLVDGSGYYIYDKDVDNNKKLVFCSCYKDGEGKAISVTERKSLRNGKMTIFTIVHLESLDWYLVATQLSSDITAPGIAMITRNIVMAALLLMTLFVLWQYKASLEQRNLLIKRQNAEKLALVGELAAGMAHEIRNPLTTIKGFTDLLKTREKYRDDRDILELLGSSVDHIEGIVRETLLLAKPQKMETGNVDLGQLVGETCDFMKNEALLKEINLELITAERPLFVNGDRQHLKQVLINIIKNSLEATPKEGSVTVKLAKIDCFTAGITVKDTGTGMPPEVLDKIGTPFFTTKDNGTGLGLSVCRRLVEEHKGVLKITSTPGRGTTVEISLPLAEMD